MATFRVKQHDTTLPLSAETDITGASITAFIRTMGVKTEIASTVPVNVTDAGAGDFDVIVTDIAYGDFDLEVLVVKDGEEIRIPAMGYHRLLISPNLDDPLAGPYVPSATLDQVIEEKFAGEADRIIPFAETAVEAAAEAGTFAAATEFDANRAGESAFQSGQSAGYALGHRNAAATSAQDAATSATAAQTARTGAETARTGAESAQTGAQTARTGAETAQSSAGTARTGAETARTGAETARTAAEAARDLAIAGQFAGSVLSSSTNLNAVTTPGVYRQPTAANATAALNYPPNTGAGFLYVTANGTEVLQEYRPQSGTQAGRRGTYLRSISTSGTILDTWRFLATQRVDQTAGRAIYTWDDVNGRDQLVYGDTGWRNITTDLINGWAIGSLQIRRVGYTVSGRIEGLNATGKTANQVVPLAAGFRGSNDRFVIFDAPGGAVTTYRGLVSAGIDIVAPTNASLLYGGFTFMTTDAWPTTLPGSAVGSIPS